MKSPADTADLLSAIRGVVLWSLERHNVPRETAVRTADDACTELCRAWGGAEHWLPSLDRKARNSLIVETIRNGSSQHVTAQQCGVSVSTVSRVVRRQGQGFGKDEWVL